jgi:two-component system cell cycle response regulator DivK
MAGETILIVEDLPESLKFTASILRREGYRVSIASTAEQALSTLRFLQPDLILVDFMLPGMNGLELSGRIKQEPRLQKSVVVALTASTDPEAEIGARQARCDGFLTKPIEARALVNHVRDFLDFGKDAPGAYACIPPPPSKPGEQGIPGLPEKELSELQESFLKGGKGVSRQLLASVDGQFDPMRTNKTVHQWIGAAGLLGYPAISQRAREVETVLRSALCTPERLRGPLTNLARVFTNPSGALSEGALQSVARALGGKRVALIGLDGDAADLMCSVLEQVGAKARLFDADQSPYSEAVGLCHVIVVHVRPDNMGYRWLAKDAPGLPALPTLFLGSTEELLSLSPEAHTRATGLLVEGCLPEEVAMRLRIAVTQTPATVNRRSAIGEPGELVIASADTGLHSLIDAKMKESGLRCRLASDGIETILLLRHIQPPVAVVDAALDGFEALAAIRAEAMPVRTVFLTSQNYEDEILRGFSLGAEDYMVYPFSVLELVARVKRLLV